MRALLTTAALIALAIWSAYKTQQAARDRAITRVDALRKLLKDEDAA